MVTLNGHFERIKEGPITACGVNLDEVVNLGVVEISVKRGKLSKRSKLLIETRQDKREIKGNTIKDSIGTYRPLDKYLVYSGLFIVDATLSEESSSEEGFRGRLYRWKYIRE